MINFIIYEPNQMIRDQYEMIILSFVGMREERFRVFDYLDYDSFKSTNNIYIISDSDIANALKIVSNIRDKGDWKSQIIVISKLRNSNLKLLMNKLLVLDYIDINNDYRNSLKEDLYIAYNILIRNKTLNFSLNSEINKIKYSNILYIEKNNNQNYCTIHTIDNDYIIKETITSLEKKLDPTFFMKIHRSCIVNLYNIEQYNYYENVIYFINGDQTDLISRDKKQILKGRLIEEKAVK